MSKNKYTIDNYSKLKRHQKNSICLFKNYLSDCNNNGKTAKNHLISKAGYLEKISHENKVLSFKFHDRDNKRFNGQLIEQTIEKVNLFNAFCSKHDNNLFNEMENRKKFDETNKKQLFQFAFRAFTFSFYQNILKNNKDFDRMVSDNLNKIAKVHLEIEKRIFEKYVFLMKEENWEGVETEIIRLNKKCEFISCWAGRVNIGTNGLYRIGPSTISINIFPDENETVILLSYLKDDTYSFDKKFCKKLKKLAKKMKINLLII